MREGLVLVTGASGFVGKALCERLAACGHRTRATVRDGAGTGLRGCEVACIPDISADTDWTKALTGVATVIHLAARVHVMHEKAPDALAEFRRVNVAGTERLARSAAANGVKRLVYVSSIKVNGESTCGNDRFAESDAPSPQDPYGISKYEAELALHRIADETGLEVVILRPPLIYGAGVKGNFAQMLKVLARGIPLPLASVRNLRSLVYVGNMVDAAIACAAHPAAAGQTYLVSDGEDVSTPELLRRLGTAMECPAKLFPCPSSWLRLAGRLTGKSEQIGRLQESLRIDSGKIRRQLNWNPPYTLQQGLQATAEWYRNTHP